MRFALEFSEGAQSKCYEAILRHAAGDSFVFDAERVFLGTLTDDEPPGLELATAPGGHAESELAKITVPTMSSYASLWPLIEGIGFFHFHDTSSTAPLRQNSAPAENISLRSDGSNLATILYRLKHSEHPDFQAAWKRIEGLIQRVAPFIKSLAPSPVAPEMPKSALQLYWQDTRGHRFEASDLSDGTLRAIALITALAQPATMLPSFIAIDEPELGLHPAALSLIASLARSVSHYSQILLSTQSPALLDEFEPDQVIVAEQHEGMRRSSESGLARVALGKASTFKRLDATELEGWLAVHALEALGAMPS
jgi:predicted ATPase